MGGSSRRTGSGQDAFRQVAAMSVAAALGAAVTVGLHGPRVTPPAPLDLAPVEESLRPSPYVAPEGTPSADEDTPSDAPAPVVVAPLTDASQQTGEPSPYTSNEDRGRTVPLPVSRPQGLGRPAREPARTAPVATPAIPKEEPGFLERFFGSFTAPQPAPGPVADRRATRQVAVPPRGSGVAVYDISARTVTLPGGQRLEAHSGLGQHKDDPRHVRLRMKGPTPAGTYELTEREALFHGVRAIRLNPVGGAGAVHGRSGLLAHTYMLGPDGDSNGCVSVKDYQRFLEAYLSGEISKLVVVEGQG